MARYHIPGPLNASRGNHAIQDGTLQRTPGMLPGPIGGAHASHASAWDPRIYIARAEAVRDAVRIGIRRAPDAILEETGHAIGDLVRGLIPGLLMTMAVEGICAVVGGAAGGLVGAAWVRWQAASGRRLVQSPAPPRASSWACPWAPHC